MHDRPSPDYPRTPAPRVRRPTWRSPRLVVGILLVVASVALGSWAVRSAGHTTAVYAVATTVTAGEEITVDDLVAVEVRLGADTALYYPLDEGLPSDLVALRTVGGHELLARSAVGPGSELATRLVSVPVTEVLSSTVGPGTLVELWHLPGDDTGEASLIASELVVAELAERGSGLLSSGTPTVQVLVPVDTLPTVLEALADDGTVAIIPVPGSAL